MIDHKKDHLALGEKNWWLGVVLLFFLIILFSNEFINGGIREVINDPIYFFSILMVGLVVATPIVWIFSRSMIFLSEKTGVRSEADKKIFDSLLSLSENFRVFQYIVIEDELFEGLAIGEKTITVISILKKNELSSIENIDAIIERTQKKVLLLEKFLGKKASIDFLLVREGESTEYDTYNLGDSEKKNITTASFIKKELETQNNRKTPLISGEIIEKIETVWKEGPKRPISGR